MTFGERVKKLRTELGLSQPMLAELVVGSRERRQLIYEWEQDNGRPSNSEWLLSLAKALGTSVSYLYGETDDPRPAPLWRTGEGPSSEWEARVKEARELLAAADSVLNTNPGKQKANPARAKAQGE